MSQRPRGFAPWRPQERTKPLLRAIDGLLVEYRDHLPLTDAAYQQVGNILVRARRAGIVPWSAIRDDGDDLPWSLVGYDSPSDLCRILTWNVEQFRLDLQFGQRRRAILICEHAGLKPQLEPICSPFGVRVIAGGGFDSVTAKHGLAALLADAGERFIALHVGDLDRAGEDIFACLSEDVAAFGDMLGGDCEFVRLAVTPEQVELYHVPTAPPKKGECLVRVVQVEAIPPDILADILQTALRDRLDVDLINVRAAESADIRRDVEGRLRRAGLWVAP